MRSTQIPKYQIQIIELLSWIKAAGFVDAREDDDICICPQTRRMKRYKKMSRRHKRTALPVPTRRHLRRAGINVSLEPLGDIYYAEHGSFSGAGNTESTAILSMLNQVRMAYAH